MAETQLPQTSSGLGDAPPISARPVSRDALMSLHPPADGPVSAQTSPCISRPTTPASPGIQSTAPSSPPRTPSPEPNTKPPSPNEPSVSTSVDAVPVILEPIPVTRTSSLDVLLSNHVAPGSEATSNSPALLSLPPSRTETPSTDSDTDSDAQDLPSSPPVQLPSRRATPPITEPGPQGNSPSDAEPSNNATSTLPARTENPFGIIASSAAAEWELRKQRNNEENSVIDELMGYVGLEEVKRQFLAIKSKVNICEEQGRDLKKERFNIIFQGNPGTGKTSIARVYARFLYSVGVVGSPQVKEKSGIKLCTKGSFGVKRMFKRMLERDGGVLFVDEAYQLTAPYTDGMGRQALDVILTTMENEIGNLAVVFVRYKDEMESFYEHNPGLSSRIPYSMEFSDFTDAELWQILHDNIRKEYSGRMKVEGGLDGFYMRVVVRRLSQARKNRGFGNARAVENLLARISSRQTSRIERERLEGKSPDPLLLTKEDLIGPEPESAAGKSQAWVDLQKLIGLETVKNCVQSMLRMTQLNYRRELVELKPLQLSLNQVFVGAPGTGKTTVAQLYGRILADIGLLSRGDLILKTPADFIGECLGKSEAKTRKILEATVGKVLVIDEAYILDAGDGSKEQDKFKTGVIDTLVAMVQGAPGEDRCIILVGYEDKIGNMFQNVNPGLSRRFPINRPFRFDNFDLPQLTRILEKKMLEQDMEAAPRALEAARDVLERALMRPNFSNAGEVDSILQVAKMNFEQRQASRPFDEQACHGKIEPEDFDKDFARGTIGTGINSRQELKGLVHDRIIDKLAKYQAISIGARRQGLRPRDQVPTNFVFKGYAGTGKTTTAQHMGKIFYDMGFLATPDVIECSATDLIGQYVGQTCPKTRKVLEKALGKVLFIDEAYRLMYGEFAAQAVDEIVHFLSQPAHTGRMVVILAGYTGDMNPLMTIYPHLSALFPEEIVFENLTPEECIGLLLRELGQSDIVAENNFLLRPEDPDYAKTARLFKTLQTIPGWGNARDIKQLAKQILGRFLEASGPERQAVRTVTVEQVQQSLFDLVRQRYGRSLHPGANASPPTQLPIVVTPPQHESTQPAETPIDIDTEVDSGTAASSHVRTQTRIDVGRRHPGGAPDSDDDDEHTPTARDDGVSDAVWAELEGAKRKQKDLAGRQRQLQRDLDAAETMLANNSGVNGGSNCDGLDGRCDGLRGQLTALQEMKQKEKKVRKKLQTMNKCVYGYSWYHVGGGWRCAGGMHYVPDQEIMGAV